VLKQHLTPTQFAGAGLVVAAIVTMQLRSRPKLRLVPTPTPTPAAPVLALEPVERLAA